METWRRLVKCNSNIKEFEFIYSIVLVVTVGVVSCWPVTWPLCLSLQVFTRFCNGLNKVEEAIKSAGKEFMWNEHLGFILTCPSNLGTGIRAGVHIKIPKMADEPRFNGKLMGNWWHYVRFASSVWVINFKRIYCGVFWNEFCKHLHDWVDWGVLIYHKLVLGFVFCRHYWSYINRSLLSFLLFLWKLFISKIEYKKWMLQDNTY